MPSYLQPIQTSHTTADGENSISRSHKGATFGSSLGGHNGE